MQFAPYTRIAEGGADADWAARRIALEASLSAVRRLLRMPYHVFWSHAVFDEALQRFLDAYLFFAPRHYDRNPFLAVPPEVVALEEELQSAVFRVFLRMSLPQESADAHMKPATFGEVLYQNWLFDIPKFMDLCGIFGRNNEKLVREMIARILEHQPKYLHDLGEAVKAIVDSMNRSSVDHGGQSILEEVAGMANLPPPAPMMNISPPIFRDLQLYVIDAMAAMTDFALVSPTALKVREREREGGEEEESCIYFLQTGGCMCVHSALS